MHLGDDDVEFLRPATATTSPPLPAAPRRTWRLQRPRGLYGRRRAFCPPAGPQPTATGGPDFVQHGLRVNCHQSDRDPRHLSSTSSSLMDCGGIGGWGITGACSVIISVAWNTMERSIANTVFICATMQC